MENNKSLVASPGDDLLAKSNVLINSKYRLTLNGQKVFFTCLLKLQEKQYTVDTETKQMIVEMPAAEVIRLLGLKKGGSIYKSLDEIADSLRGTSLGYSDPEKEMFDYITLVSRATYKDGVFTAKFNPEAKEFLVKNLFQNGFTKLSRKIMMSWSNTYSYRLYELLRQRAWYPKDYKGEKSGLFTAYYDIYELKLLLGVIDSNDAEVKKILKKTNPPDYKRACEACPEKYRHYDKWKDFKSWVLDTAVKEINKNEISEVTIEYDLLRKAHREVYAINFKIYLKDLYDKESSKQNATTIIDDEAQVDMSAADKFVMQMNVFALTEQFALTPTDVLNICETASYNYELIEKYVEMLKNSSQKISNVTGWLIAAIKNGYEAKEYENSSKQGNNYVSDRDIEDVRDDIRKLEELSRRQ